jgi:hypothetical protein
VSPFYRFKIVDEERKKRKDQNSKKTMDLYGNFMNKDVVHGINEQDALLLQSLIEGSDDVIRVEHKQIQVKLTLLEQQKNKLIQGGISCTIGGVTDVAVS